MVRQNWILLALVGAVLIYEASGLKCVVCNTPDPECVGGTKQGEDCPVDVTSCYLRITNNLIDRGCLPVVEANGCPTEEGSSCISCATDGCNNQQWLQCHECATTDPTCSEAKAGTGTLCEKYKAVNRCYERFTEGKVERGCESDVMPVTPDVCQGNEQCNACSANDCNSNAGREFQVTKCVQCNDATDSCLDGSKLATNCAAPSDGKCYTRILDDGTLKRGCHSELSQAEITACTGPTCSICETEDGCNKGIFPADRLQCHQCQKTAADASCAEDLTSEATSKICKLYKSDDKCYSRVKADSSFDRGCQSDLPDNEKSCNGLENCFECSSKNCNSLSEQKLKDTTKCQRCNSDEPACLAGTAPAQSCGKADDVCFVRINNGKLERDCLSTLTIEAEQIKCNTESDKTCIACTASGCNNQKWLKCHKCLGAACNAVQVGSGDFCTNHRESNKCYERFVDGKDVERGCESDLDPATENVCVGNQQCKACSEEDGCNKDVSTDFQETKCIQCKSDNDADKSCLQGTKAGTICANPDGKCFSRIIAGGILERGCRSALPVQEQTDCNGENLCNLCGEAGCNEGIFPADRLLCYQCENSNGNDVSCAGELTGDDKSGVCAVYKKDDKCYTRITAALNFERGCSSALGDNDCNGQDNCLKCDGKNCNSISEQKLKTRAKCLQCDSSDPACVDTTALAAFCNIEEDTCFVRLNNGKLERNCLSVLSVADQAKCKDANDQSCVTCSAQGCNVQKWTKCHQCKETSSAACNNAQSDANAQFCPKYKDGNECYERLESEKVVRGCANDLSEAPCKDNLECRTCPENGCNKAAASTLQTDQRCLQCSTVSDAGGHCLAGTAASQPCRSDSKGKCFSQIQTDGHLKRGCQGDLTDAQITDCKGDKCSICDSKGCNKDVFPAKRLKCYQCKSSDLDPSCKNELQGADKSSYCKLYVEQDKCYSRDANDIFERGCQSDLGLNVDACKDIDDKHCKSCGESDCNAISKERLNGAGAITLNVMLVAVMAFAAVAGL